MRTFITMCSSPLYRPFHWLYPGSWQPLQPTAALLIDMRKNPTSPDARESRVILDMLFSLLGPEGRITAGTGEGYVNVGQRYMANSSMGAWSLLDKLRKKVWRQLGLDSSVMWSRGLSESADEQGSQGASQAASAGMTPISAIKNTNTTTTNTEDGWNHPASLDSFLGPTTNTSFDPFHVFSGTTDAAFTGQVDSTFPGAGFGGQYVPTHDPTFDMSTMAGGLSVGNFDPQLPDVWNTEEWSQWPNQRDGYPQT